MVSTSRLLLPRGDPLPGTTGSSTMSATPTDDDTLDLIDAGAELRDAHGVNATYNQLYKACLDGMVPEVRVRGRWRLRRADLPRIAATLGRNRQPARAKPSERSPAAA